MDLAALNGLTGKPRRALYLKLRAEANAARRAKARLPTRHAVVIRSLIHAQMLPAPGVDGLTADEHRKLRNKLKAMRRKQRP